MPTRDTPTPCPIHAVLVCGGRYHDFDYARLELLALLAAEPRVRTHVASDYSAIAALDVATSLVTYTCDLRPSTGERAALERFLARGGRWFALHATNSLIEWTAEGRVGAPRTEPELMNMLGSQFLAHPPLMEYDVEVSDPAHPLVAGLGSFRIRDEMYLSEYHGPHRLLLHTHYNGRAQRGFVDRDWHSDERRPVMYLRESAAGEVLYLAAGHCRGHYDMAPLVPYEPTVEHGPWETLAFRELLARGLRWATRLREFA